MCLSSTLTVLDKSDLFRGLLLAILGPEAISIVVEPQDVLTCWSSTLVVLADSGPFHGLLLTVLGSQSNFHGCRTPRCAYVSVINTPSFGRFWPVSWTITHCFGVPEWFPCLTNPVVRLRVGHQHCSFGRFWPVSWTIT